MEGCLWESKNRHQGCKGRRQHGNAALSHLLTLNVAALPDDIRDLTTDVRKSSTDARGLKNVR